MVQTKTCAGKSSSKNKGCSRKIKTGKYCWQHGGGNNNDESKWIIYGKDHCPYTQNAKKLLQSKGIPFEYHPMDNSQHRMRRGRMVKQGLIPSTHMTVPIVMSNGRFIGGYDDLMSLLS